MWESVIEAEHLAIEMRKTKFMLKLYESESGNILSLLSAKCSALKMKTFIVWTSSL